MLIMKKSDEEGIRYQRPFAKGLRNSMDLSSFNCAMYRCQCQINELEKLENYICFNQT